jgi:hypothetical protein
MLLRNSRSSRGGTVDQAKPGCVPLDGGRHRRVRGRDGLPRGRTKLERLAWAVVVFGAWDIVYYLGLRLSIGWPPSLDAWDVLFLIPSPWVGPVWAPIVVSAALVASGLTAARRLRAGGAIVVGRIRALVALAGGILVAAAAAVSALARRSTAPAMPGVLLQYEPEPRPPVGAPD